jgi:hypothetical protein
MRESLPLGELMHRDFVVLHDEDDDVVLRKLQAVSKPVAVIVNHSGDVVGVWSRVGGRGTPIVASTDTPVEDIAESGVLLRELSRNGSAIVVRSGTEPVGVVPAGTIAEYLAVQRGLRVAILGEVAAGDSGLAGGHTQSLLVIVCGVCGTRNELQSWVEGVTLCQNPAPPHVLVRR